MTAPARGEIWIADLSPTRGREQSGRRPALVISEDLLNRGPADLVIILPVTSTLRSIPSHVVLTPPEGGLRTESAVLCEAVRSIAKQRLVERWGVVSPEKMRQIEDILRILMRL